MLSSACFWEAMSKKLGVENRQTKQDKDQREDEVLEWSIKAL
jgi:hypothetical protein